MQSIISVQNLVKTYASGFQALKGVDLEIRRGEIFALLGPNGAGITAQIGMIGPMSTIILSVLILEEPFTIWIALGTGLVVTGVWLLARYRMRSDS